MTEAFVLDASFALHWCFEDEAKEGTEAVLTALQNQETIAWVPSIWPFEILNGLGKAVTRGRVDRQRAFHFWREIRELPVEIVNSPVDEKLLELALEHNLAVYDATYLSLASSRKLPLATGDSKLQRAAGHRGIDLIKP